MKKIMVSMLGGFSIQEGTNQTDKQINLSGRSRRIWTLIAYLIIHRDRGVTAQELLDTLWPESEKDNPLSTLQNNISRARAALSGLGLSESKNLIKYHEGIYQWAPDAQTEVDAEQFDRMLREMELETDEQNKLEKALKAISLYNGDFLPEISYEPWCINLNSYYRASYLRVCRTTIKKLAEENRMTEVETICKSAIQIDPMVEEFTLYLMKALTKNGNPKEALEQYEVTKKMYDEHYGVGTSVELDLEKAAAIRAFYGQEMGANEVADFLNAAEEEDGAFYCDNNVFREVVQLYRRTIARSGGTAQLMLVSMDEQNNAEQQSINMKRLERTLLCSLRSGDPFTKMNGMQFLILLPGATRENGQVVLNRILERMKQDYPHSHPNLQHLLLDIEIVKK